MSAVSLSNLPRAALSAKEGYWWINGIALALSAVIARMSWSAYDALGQQDRALVCIVAQAVAIAAAILARRGMTGQMAWAALPCLVLSAGCAWWASHGLALAWYDDADRNGEPMVIFMAVLEPALFLLTEHIREGREALRAAVEKDERETAEELARIRARQDARDLPAPAAAPAQTGEVLSFSRAVAGSAAVVGVAASPVAAQPVEAGVVQPPLFELTAHSAQTWASPEAFALHLIQNEGVRHRNELSRRCGYDEQGRLKLSNYKAAQLLDVYAPGWSRKRPIAA